MEHSSLGRLVSVLFAPSATFRSIAERPTWVWALLLSALAPAVYNAVAFTKIDVIAMLTDQLEKQGQEVPPGQLETIASFTTWAAPVGALVAAVVFALIMALVLWLSLKVVGGEFSFRHAVAVVSYSSIPTVIGFALRTVVAATKQEITVEMLQGNQLLLSNLGFLAPEDASAFVRGLLGAIDVFSLWSLGLMVIGFQIVGKLSRGKVIAIAGALWVIATLLGVYFGAQNG